MHLACIWGSICKVNFEMDCVFEGAYARLILRWNDIYLNVFILNELKIKLGINNFYSTQKLSKLLQFKFNFGLNQFFIII